MSMDPNTKEGKVRQAMLDLYDRLYARKVSSGWDRKLKAASVMNYRVGEDGVEPFNRHDSTVLSFADTLVNGMVSAIMPESDYWFRFTTWGANTPTRGKADTRGRGRNANSRSVRNGGKWKPDLVLLDDITGAKDYFEDCSQKVLSHFSEARFYRTMETVIRDGLVFGFGVQQTVDDVAGDRCYYKVISPIETVLQADDKGEVEIYFRRYYTSALDMLMRYGEECPREVRSMSAVEGPTAMYEMTEAIIPKGILRDYATGAQLSPREGKRQTYDHYVYCRDIDCFIETSTFQEMPISVWNYKQIDTSPYGTGLFEQILPEMLDLDDLKLQRKKSLKYSNDPAWQVTPNAAKHFSVKSNAVNIVSSGASTGGGPEIAPIMKPEVYDKYTADIEDMRMQIRELCYIDLYKTVLGSTDTRKTATEINISKTEASQLITATIGNLQSMVQVIVKRTFNVLRRRGDIVPPDNEEIESLFRYIRVEFDSVFIQRMRTYYMVEGNMSILNMVQVLYQVFPDMRYVINFDRLTRMLASGLGVSEYAIYDTKESEEMKQQAAQIAQEQMQMQNMQMQSQAGLNDARAQQAMSQAMGGMQNA